MTPRKSAETGRVRILWVGETTVLCRYLLTDPFFEFTIVPALTQGASPHPYEIIRKSIRLYMPRRFEDLIGKYEVMSLNYAAWDHLAHRAEWLSNAVLDGGLGLFMTGGGLSFRDWFTSTTLGEVLPVDIRLDAEAYQLFYGQLVPAKLRVLKPNHPFMASLPWSGIGAYGTFFTSSPVRLRAGGEVLADLVPISLWGETNPGFIWWDVGKGRSFAMTGTLRPPDIEFTLWEYFHDWSSNLHLFMADQEMPPDILVLHELRRSLRDCHVLKDMLTDFSDFVSKLGGNSGQIDQAIAEANEDLRQIGSMYLTHDFEGGLALASQLNGDLGESMDLAMKVKDDAFLWIYLIEWSVVTGTFLTAGVIVWNLLVKRRLYAEVEATRLARTPA